MSDKTAKLCEALGIERGEYCEKQHRNCARFECRDCEYLREYPAGSELLEAYEKALQEENIAYTIRTGYGDDKWDYEVSLETGELGIAEAKLNALEAALWKAFVEAK